MNLHSRKLDKSLKAAYSHGSSDISVLTCSNAILGKDTREHEIIGLKNQFHIIERWTSLLWGIMEIRMR